MSIYKFRILIEEESEDNIFRDIEIRSTQNFEEFHQIILTSFGFDNSQMASFYVSDDNWNKGQEIALFDMNIGEEGELVLTMSETNINSQVNCVGQHLIYTYDFLNMWNFYIELIEISVKEKEISYPHITHVQGKAPSQNSRNNELSHDEIANELMDAEENVTDDDLFSDDMFEDFDDFENYE